MKRKICTIGNSKGVSIPVDVKLDEKNARIVIEPIKKRKRYFKGVNRKFVSQVNDFIEKYEPALKELAKK